MKKLSLLVIIIVLLALFLFLSSGVEKAEGKLNLSKEHPPLPSIDVAKCIVCHDDLREKEFVHAPVKEGECDSCHEMRKEGDRTIVRLADDIDTLCLACHADIEEVLTRKNVHPAVEEGCSNCHSPHASNNPNLLSSSQVELCAACHGIEEEDFKNKHGRQPVGLTGCGTCHNPHASNEEKLFVGRFKHLPFQEGECVACHKRPRGAVIRLRGKKGALCYSCHSDKEKEFVKTSIHTPVRKGECSKCHNPHLSDNKFQLVRKGNNLCLGCHKEIKELLSADNIHPPAEESCFNCHSAHAADNSFILNEKAPSICLNCHDDKTHGFKQKHYQQKGESLNCAECHNPHGSANERLLNTYSHPPFIENECETCHEDLGKDKKIKLIEDDVNEMCYACHDDKRFNYGEGNLIQHGAIEADGCTACHSPHASSRSSQLRDHTSRLCLSCHEERDEERRKGKYIHPVIDETGCEACHEPHSSANASLLVEKPNQLCLECHLQEVGRSPSGKEVTVLGKIKLLDSELFSFKKISLSQDLTQNHPQRGHIVTGFIPPLESSRKKKRIESLIFSGELTCLSCHDSHAGASSSLFADGLSRRSQVCLKCHRK